MNLKPKVFNREKAKSTLENEIYEHIIMSFEENAKTDKSISQMKVQDKIQQEFFEEFRKISFNLSKKNITINGNVRNLIL